MVAIPPPPFHVQSTIDDVKTFSHHNSVSQLWQSRWRPCCVEGSYPFDQGQLEDFEPIFQTLIETSNDDISIVYKPDVFAQPFLPVAQALARRGDAALSAGQPSEALKLYLRSNAVYRIARFPVIRSPLGRQAWDEGLAVYEKAGKLMNPPLHPLRLPFTKVDRAAGDLSDIIGAHLRVPTQAPRPANGYPVIVLICGLDAYRTDHHERCEEHLKRGFAVLALELPSVADSPCAPRDVQAPDRYFDSVFEWLRGEGAGTFALDPARAIVRGISTGGHYAFRVAHTHADCLFAAVSHGGGAHWMFAEEWIRAQDHMEYPFALAEAIAHKFGYDGVEEFIADKPIEKYSLENTGILNMRSCRLLYVNGTEDSVFPVEDGLLVAARGRAKDIRLMEGRKHMGNPGGEDAVYEWIEEVMKQQ